MFLGAPRHTSKAPRCAVKPRVFPAKLRGFRVTEFSIFRSQNTQNDGPEGGT